MKGRQIPIIPYNNSMAQLNVSIPPALKSWIDHRVAEGRYSSASDYVRDLVRRDQNAEPDDVEWVKRMVAQGLDSGRMNQDPRDVLRDIIAEYPADRG
jgi:antitoxin ParD1/3/4